jgi:hypothetical protein
MKYLLVLFILPLSVAAQKKNEGDKFLGMWYHQHDAHKTHISECVIRRKGNEFTLQYVIGSGDLSKFQVLFYKLKGDSLVGEDKRYGNVVFIPSNGHIKWKAGEFNRDTTIGFKLMK